jgi:hypothetical protein
MFDAGHDRTWEGRGRRIHLEISNDAPLSSLSRMGKRLDLNRMRREDAKRYAAFWRGRIGARTGRGAVGRSIADNNSHFSRERTGERPRVPLVQFDCCIKIDERSPWAIPPAGVPVRRSRPSFPRIVRLGLSNWRTAYAPTPRRPTLLPFAALSGVAWLPFLFVDSIALDGISNYAPPSSKEIRGH